jgi:ketosteroid isomerase-like protein
MKSRLVIAFVGIAIGIALMAFADTNTPNPRLRQKLLDVIAKHADAMNKNDAAAATACFTQDAVYVTDRGPINGREAIEEVVCGLVQECAIQQPCNYDRPGSPHVIGTAGNQMWATGEWSTDIKGKDFGPIQIKGYWSVIREGEDWKIRMLTSNSTPAPGK